MSLVMVMMSVGLSMTIAAGLAQIFSSGMRSQLSVELRSDLESTRQGLRKNMDCAMSLQAELPVCAGTADHYLTVKTRKGVVLIPDLGEKGSKIGRWNLRAKCSKNKMTIEAARFRPDGNNFAVDPLTRQPQEWRDVFPSMPVCEEHFERQANYMVANLEQGSVGAPATINCKTSSACSETTILGSKLYKPIGTRLLLTTNATLGSIGKEQRSSIDVVVYKASTQVSNDKDVHYTYGNTSDTPVYVASAAQRLVEVTPGEQYKIEFVFRGDNTKPSGKDMAFNGSPVTYTIADYASQ